MNSLYPISRRWSLLSRLFDPFGDYNILPSESLRSLNKEFNELFKICNVCLSDGGIFTDESRGKYPAVDIKDEKDKYIITMAVAGHSKDDISVEMGNDGWLIVRGKSINDNSAGDGDKSKYIIKTIKRSSFEKCIYVNVDEIQIDAITSHCDNGLLTITIPKKINAEHKKEARIIKVE